MCGMAGNSEHDAKAEQRLASEQRLARGIVEWSKKFVPRGSHRIEIVVAVETAGVIAKCAGGSFEYGHPEDGYRSLSFAQDLQHTAMMTVLLPAAEHGQIFKDAPKKPRRIRVTIMIDNALAALGRRASPSEVLCWIKADDDARADADRVIDEIVDDPEGPIVYWRGRKRPTKYKSLCNRVAERRKFF